MSTLPEGFVLEESVEIEAPPIQPVEAVMLEEASEVTTPTTQLPDGFVIQEEAEVGPFRGSYKGLNSQIASAMPKAKEEKEVSDTSKAMSSIYVGKGASVTPEQIEQQNKDLKAFGRDIPRIVFKVSKNLTTTALNNFLPEGTMEAIDKLPPEQRNKILNQVTDQAIGYAVPLLAKIDWNSPKIIDPETNRIQHLESVSGLAVDMGAFMYLGNKATAGAKLLNMGMKNYPRISSTVANFVGYTTAGVITLDPDINLANVVESFVVDPENPEEDYLAKGVVDFMAANPDDTTSEKQLKIAMETAAFPVIFSGLGLATKIITGPTKAAFTGTRKLLLGKKPSEMSEQEVRETAMSFFKEARLRQSLKGNIDDLQETEAGLRQIDNQAFGGKTFGGRVGAVFTQLNQRIFTSRGLASPLLYEAAMNAKHSQRQLITAAEDTAERLTAAFKSAGNDPVLLKKVGVLMESDLSSAFKVAPEKRISFFANQRKIPEDVAEAVLTARQSIDELSQKALKIEGFTKEAKEAIKNQEGTYIRASYDAFEKVGWTADKELKRLAKEATARGIVSAAKNKAIDKGIVLSEKRMDTIIKNADAKADIQIDKMLEDIGPLTDYVAQAKRVGKFHKRNHNLSPEIKALLGEVKNPADRIILSISKAARIVELQNFYNITLKLGHNKYIFNANTKAAQGLGPKGKRYTSKIEKTNSELDGMYTTPQIAEMLAGKQATFNWVESDNALSEAYRYFITSKGFAQSMKTIYSLSTQARNVLGASQMAGANGVVFEQANEMAYKVLATRLNKAVGTAAERKVYQEAYQEYQGLGVINTQLNVNQAREMMEGGFEGFGKRRKQIKALTEDVPVLGAAIRTLDKGVEKLGASSVGDITLRKPAAVYTASDDFFKIGVYESELKTLREAWGNTVDDSLLKNEAANMVKNNMPNYDRVPNTLKALGKMPFGNFVAFPAEIVRTSAHILKQSWKEMGSANAVIRKRGLQRMAGFTTASVGYYGIAKGSQIAMGFSDQEVEDRKLLASGPFSAGHDMIFTRDSNGDVYGLNTQYLNSYYTLQAPFRTGYDIWNDGTLKGKEFEDKAVDAITAAVIEITKPYITESIAVGPIRSLVSAYWNKSGRDSEGKLIISDKDGVHWDAVMDVLTKSFEPAFLTKTEQLVDAINEKPSDWDQSYKSPKYEAWSQIGFKWDKQDLARNFYDVVKSHQILDRLNGLDRIRVSTKVEDVAEDIMKTNAVEFQNQQDLYVYVKAARRQLDDVDVIVQLREAGYSKENAERLMSGQFKATRLPMNQLELNSEELQRLNETDFHKYQEKLKEIDSLATDLFIEMDTLPLDKARSFDFDFDREFLNSNPPLTPEEREEAGLAPLATGGVVSEPVSNAPAEPDERINKLTGLPYNESAGPAYMDTDDPLRVLNMAKGGKVLNQLRRNCK
jgi:hypothetical protein